MGRPVVVIGGSSDRNQETTGAFQEFPQVMHVALWIFLKKFLALHCFAALKLLLFVTRWRRAVCTANFLPDPAA